jgi:hypothetical protein
MQIACNNSETMLYYCEAIGVKTMEIKVKPVQPSEIKDPKIAREAIAQARRIPTAADLKRMQERAESFNRLLVK